MDAEAAGPPARGREGFAARDWGMLCGAAGIWGASFLFTAEALEAFEPGLITLCRIGFGLLTLSLFPASRAPVAPVDRARVRLLGLTWMAFPLTLFPLAQQWIDSSLTGMLNSAMPVLTVVVTAVLFRGPVRRPQLVGVAVGLVGILMMGLPTARAGSTNALGVALVVLAVGSYGIAVNIAGPLQQRYGALPVLVRALRFAFVLVLPYGLVGLVGSSFQTSSLLSCVVLGAGGTGVAFVLSANLAGRQGPIASALVTYLMPVVSVVLGVVFRGEDVSGWELAGCAVVLAGAWLASLGGRQIRVSART